jgi:hypothetical protein
MYRYIFSCPRHYLEVSGHLHALAALPPISIGLGGWVDRRGGLDDVEKRKFFTIPVLNSDPSVVQPVARHYTDYCIPAPG